MKHPWAEAIVGRSPRRVRPAVALLVRTALDAREDRIVGLAAEIAFFLMLALPPLVLAFLSAAGLVGDVLGTGAAMEVRSQLVAIAAAVFSTDTMEAVVLPTIDRVLDEGRLDVLSLGALVALWSASRALHVVVGAITIAYDLEPQRRRGWVRRLASLGGTLAGVVGGLALVLLLVAGPRLGENLAALVGAGGAFATVWGIAYWPVVVAAGTGLVTTLYHVGAPWSTPWKRDLPGALVALALAAAGSVALRAYAAAAIEGDTVYSALAAPLVVLLWLYVLGFSLLLGAELNAEIERMWPTSGAPLRVASGMEPAADRTAAARRSTTVPPIGDAP